MNGIRETLQEKLIEQGIFKIGDRHFYECSFDELVRYYRRHAKETEEWQTVKSASYEMSGEKYKKSRNMF
ncbi:hypothetical protein AM501_30675 [Aneurinibacillus migulanus]|uniref:Fur-regulated basic protein FbpA n=1 Tax=Aneurinibacillus migulanus TaxID=47500 RepID=UPI0005BBB81F|nr:Fur-regulated basic protein FbpA [Aneurinibacillus migulanus]KIV53801.1 hypothetical protein TS64_17930 [Aneurinibacillus migulanus]KPD04643.1 hypothetical protein AM501_30675 [Aneurinibacillus migulanus]